MADQRAELEEFSKFYVENVPRLVAFLICQGFSVPDAADCVQEAMIDALPPVWTTLEHPYGWCRVVAYRKACDLAKRRREALVADPGLTGCPLVAVDTDLQDLEQRHELLYWLARLGGSNQRQVLVWAYDGATPAEIAAALDMGPATVRSTLRNARAVLRRLRANDGDQR